MDGTTEIVGSLMILFVIVILSRRLIKRGTNEHTESEENQIDSNEKE
ncbi:hypothetical protein [Gimesia aquarii]|uniref:Uncharacterized protein n=1 Tax=Gimesia aquarii TaxID=2527964 RepID=A0A517VZU5_9PLAN|nr:hypothetical protein [Gimesia aquarii]QDT98527.1 hypothetical protein V144x_40330 [Gimesia aquarii]